MTPERREARRAEIVTAARRCFSRQGFHQTSMPDIAAEAGLSTGAPYRYFASKEEIITEIAGQAFALIFDPVQELAARRRQVTLADLLTAAVTSAGGETVRDANDEPVPVAELFRCTVQAWGEILRHDELRETAQAGFDRVRGGLAGALRAGQEAGAVAAGVDVDQASRLIMALMHGFLLQRVAFDLDDTEDFVRGVRAVLESPSLITGS
jgi:AcrR family transcriptional regulator